MTQNALLCELCVGFVFLCGYSSIVFKPQSTQRKEATLRGTENHTVAVIPRHGSD